MFLVPKRVVRRIIVANCKCNILALAKQPKHENGAYKRLDPTLY